MSEPDLSRMHAENVLRAVERQRNEALSREAQKDAVIGLLQAQNAVLAGKLQSLEANAKEQEDVGAGRRKDSKVA